MDRLNRDDQIAIVLPGQDSFNSIQRTSLNADSLSYLQKGMLFHQDLFSQQGFHTIDLFLGDRNSHPTHSDETRASLSLQHPQPTRRTKHPPGKSAAAAEGHFDFFFPAPP